MSPKEILIKAKELIQNKDNWIQGSYARDSKNNLVMVRDENACRFCAMGAIMKIADARLGSEYYKAREVLMFEAKNILNDHRIESAIVHLNDTTGHEKVMELFDAAIANELEKELWLKIADQFDLLSIGEVTKLNTRGLCSAVKEITNLDPPLFDSMLDKINIFIISQGFNLNNYIGPIYLFNPQEGIEFAPKRAKLARAFAEGKTIEL